MTEERAIERLEFHLCLLGNGCEGGTVWHAEIQVDLSVGRCDDSAPCGAEPQLTQALSLVV